MQTQTPESYQRVLQQAKTLYQQDPDWVSFFRQILGIDGITRQTFPGFEDLTTFERSEEFEEIQKMLVKLREKKPSAETETEPTRVITVRLPKSMHEYLRTEAHDLRTSMNKLCISKLLQMIEQDMIPAERSGAPKRRTTPAPTPQPQATQPQAVQPAASGQQPSLAGHQPSSGNGQSPFTSNY